MKSVTLALVAFSSLVAGSASADQAGAANLSAYRCDRARTTIAIDGKLDEPAWKQAPVLGMRVPVSGSPATEVRALWDDTCVYFGIKAYDPDIWSYLTARDSRTCAYFAPIRPPVSVFSDR